MARATIVGAASVILLVASACAGDPDRPPLSLPNLLVTADALPEEFSVAAMSVDDLIVANRSTLEKAADVSFSPETCRPSADAQFNPQLSEDNAALLVASSEEGTFSELATTVRRDIDADRRASSGPCRVVTATPRVGTLAGAKIVTTSTELAAVKDPAVEQAYSVRSDSVTTLPSGDRRARVALLANVLVRTASGETVTVQVGVSSADRELAPGQGTARAPLTDAAFVDLVRAAVAHASR